MQVSVHVHSAQESGHISKLESILHPKTGEVSKQRPRAVAKGQTALVEITLTRPICVEVFADYKALGRVALRDAGHTVAVGLVMSLLSNSCD